MLLSKKDNRMLTRAAELQNLCREVDSFVERFT